MAILRDTLAVLLLSTIAVPTMANQSAECKQIGYDAAAAMQMRYAGQSKEATKAIMDYLNPRAVDFAFDRVAKTNNFETIKQLATDTCEAKAINKQED